MKRLCKLISDWMGVLVLVAALAGLLFPGTFCRLKPALINPLLGVIMSVNYPSRLFFAC